MCEVWKNSRHPLIAAIFVCNPELMKLILQNLCDINENIYGHLSPLLIAIYLQSLIGTKLIVSMGADINRPCIHGRTPLMNSTSDYDICCYLISQGADINHQDREGFTALHLGISNSTKSCTHNLINAGADLKIQNNEGMNALTWAAINLNAEELNRLIEQPAYSVLDMIETFEILNASCVCAQKLTLEGWQKALEIRRVYDLPKNCQIPAQEILDFSQEFTTEIELERIKDDPLRLGFQGILIIERILGRNNRQYIKFLLQTALIAKKRNNLDKVKQLIAHIQENCQETSFVTVNFYYFNKLFNEFAKDKNSEFFFEYGGFTLFKMIVRATLKMWIIVKEHVFINPYLIDGGYTDLVDTALFMISAIRYCNLFHSDVGQFKEEVNKLVREDIRLLYHQSILHRAIKLMKKNLWSTVDLLRLLLESGADGNAKDCFERTPLVYATMNVPEMLLDEVLTLFNGYGIYSESEQSKDRFSIDDTK